MNAHSREVSGLVRIGLDGKVHLTPAQCEELFANRMNAQAKHTPGPWRVLRCPDGDWVFLAFNGQTALPMVEPNAKLIAAAPELLEACHFALKYAEMRASKGTPLPVQLVGRLQAAIALAEKGRP